MSPGNMKQSHLRSSGTFLAIDETLFSSEENVTRGLCPAVKYFGNPVICNEADGPDARRAHVLGAAYVNGRIQLWYLAQDAEGRWQTCYAESGDGYTFRKPSLGLFDYKGSTDNNIIEQRPDDFSITNIYVDPNDSDPARRYRAPVYGNLPAELLLTDEDRQRYGSDAHPCIETFAYSADGIRWTYDRSIHFPLRKKIEAGALFKRGDEWFMAHQMIWGEYPGLPIGKRYLGVSHSSDFARWEFADAPGLNLDLGRPGDRSVQTHVTPMVIDYGGTVVGVVGLFYDHPELYEQETDLMVVMTNDGYQWRQPLAGQPFAKVVGRGEPGSWDHSFLVQGGMTNTPDRTLIYYSAAPVGGNLGYLNRQVGVAELPRDRFGYIAPAVGWAYSQRSVAHAVLISKPIHIESEGLSLYLNVRGSTREGDSVRVELIGEDGLPVPGYTLDDCQNVVEDGLDVCVQWKTSVLPRGLVGTGVCVKIELMGKNHEGAVMASVYYPRLFGFHFRL